MKQDQIKLAVLDMAGTTVNEDNVVYKTVQKVINDQGFPVTFEQVLEFGAGKEKYQAIKDVLTACTSSKEVEKVAAEAFENFKPELIKAYAELEVKSFPGVKDTIDLLRSKGIAVALNTGYSKKIAASLLEKLDWEIGRDIDALVTADDVTNGRPHPDMIFKAMEICGVSEAKNVLKAGDSVIDIEEGKNAGCALSIGVLSGAQHEEQLKAARPDHILGSVSDLKELLVG